MAMKPIHAATALLLAGWLALSPAPALAAAVSYTLSFPGGWTLAGNSLTTPIDVKAVFGAQTNIQTVWKWDPAGSKWAFYAPSLDASGTLAAYAASKAYSVLTTINQGEGYWVNALAPVPLGNQSGTGFSLAASNLATGWNLAATADNVSPATFTTGVGNVTTLWAWDNASAAWYFHAPSLAANSTQASYILSKGYKDFAALTLDNGLGFWVNYAGAATSGGASPVFCGDATSIDSFFASNKGLINVSRTGGNTGSGLYQQFGSASSYRAQILYQTSNGNKSVILSPVDTGSSLQTLGVGPEDVLQVTEKEVNVLFNATPAQPQVGLTGVLQCEKATGVWTLAIAAANSALNNVTLTSTGAGSTGSVVGAGLYTAVTAKANSDFQSLLNTACSAKYADSNGSIYTNCTQGAATAAASLYYNMWVGGLPHQTGGEIVSGPSSVSPGTAKVSANQGMAGVSVNDSCTVIAQEPYVPFLKIQTNGARYFADGVNFSFNGTGADTITVTSQGIVVAYTMTNGQGGKIEVHPDMALFGTGKTGPEAYVWSDYNASWTTYFTCK